MVWEKGSDGQPMSSFGKNSLFFFSLFIFKSLFETSDMEHAIFNFLI